MCVRTEVYTYHHIQKLYTEVNYDFTEASKRSGYNTKDG